MFLLHTVLTVPSGQRIVSPADIWEICTSPTEILDCKSRGSLELEIKAIDSGSIILFSTDINKAIVTNIKLDLTVFATPF